MFGASSELASVMEFGFYYISTGSGRRFLGVRPFVKRFAQSSYAIGPMSCLSVCLSVCDVGVLWLNGSMDRDATWYGGRP